MKPETKQKLQIRDRRIFSKALKNKVVKDLTSKRARIMALKNAVKWKQGESAASSHILLIEKGELKKGTHHRECLTHCYPILRKTKRTFMANCCQY